MRPFVTLPEDHDETWDVDPEYRKRMRRMPLTVLDDRQGSSVLQVMDGLLEPHGLEIVHYRMNYDGSGGVYVAVAPRKPPGQKVVVEFKTTAENRMTWRSGTAFLGIDWDESVDPKGKTRVTATIDPSGIRAVLDATSGLPEFKVTVGD